MTIKGVTVIIYLVIDVMNHGPSTIDASLEFKGSISKRPNKRQLKGGETRDRTSTTVHFGPRTWDIENPFLLQKSGLPQFHGKSS